MNKIEAAYSLLKEIKHQCKEHPSEWDLEKVREWLDA